MERQRDKETIELLKKLRTKLFSNNISMARVAAFKLSHLQEDGFLILKEVLFGDYPKTAKKAAGYGMRSTKGRMKKMSLELLEEGLKHADSVTREVCIKSLRLLIEKNDSKAAPPVKSSRKKIRDVQPSSKSRKSGNVKSLHPNSRSCQR